MHQLQKPTKLTETIENYRTQSAKPSKHLCQLATPHWPPLSCDPDDMAHTTCHRRFQIYVHSVHTYGPQICICRDLFLESKTLIQKEKWVMALLGQFHTWEIQGHEECLTTFQKKNSTCQDTFGIALPSIYFPECQLIQRNSSLLENQELCQQHS